MKLLKTKYLQYIAYALIILSLLVFAVIKCKFILAPLTIGVLFSLALNSILTKLKKRIKSNFLSVTIVTGVLFLMLSSIFILITSQISNFYKERPNIDDKMILLVSKTEDFVGNTLNIKHLNLMDATSENKEQLISSGSSILFSFFGSASSVFMYLTLIPIYIFLMLLYRDEIKESVKNILTPLQIKIQPLFNQTAVLIQNYLKGLFFVILILGIANSVGLYFIGVPYALVLGFLVAFLGIIPYIGIVIGSILVLFVSFVTNQSIPQLFQIIALFVIIQFIEGNFITPKIIGDKLNINPLLALIVLLIGQQLWGIVGMIIALPITAMITIAVSNIKNKTFLN